MASHLPRRAARRHAAAIAAAIESPAVAGAGGTSTVRSDGTSGTGTFIDFVRRRGGGSACDGAGIE